MEWNNGMEQLDSHIFNAITKLRNDKKQPNENSVYNYILKTVESLTTEQLENRLRDLIKANKINIHPLPPHQILFFLKKHPSRHPS